MHIWAMGYLVYAKTFQNLQKKSIYLDLNTSYAKSSKFSKKFRDSATVQSKLTIFYFFLFEHKLWTKGDLWVPQAWSSVNPLDHNKHFPLRCPSSLDFETCENGSVFAN